MLPLWQQGYLRNIFQRNCCRSSADQSIFHSLAINLFWNVWKIQKEANLKSTNHNNRKSSPFFQEINASHNTFRFMVDFQACCVCLPCLGRTLLVIQLDRWARIISEVKQFPLKKKYHGSWTWWKIRNHLLQIWIIDIKCIIIQEWRSHFFLFASILRSRTLTKQPPRKEIPKSQLHPLAPSLSPWKTQKTPPFWKPTGWGHCHVFHRKKSLGTPNSLPFSTNS